jgi:hypothetical protein
MRFPAAALGGVSWSTLARKYEERYSSRLNVASLGHSTPLAAATALLWDVLRLVDGSDPQNPVVAAEDATVLSARPSLMGSWPSLYQSLCAVVAASGTVEPAELVAPAGADAAGGAPKGPVRSLLLSKLKPLLQIHWHADFDETNLAFMNEDGSVGRVKKMKHVVTAVLRWRAQRVARRRATGGRPSAVDLALAPRLELAASTGHNDMVLRLLAPTEACEDGAASVDEAVVMCPSTPLRLPLPAQEPRPAELPTAERAESAACGAPRSTEDVAHELAMLRAENAELRCMNKELMRDHTEDMPNRLQTPTPKHAVPQLMAEIFDDPFEPPPQKEQLWGPSSCSTPVSTTFGSSFDFELFSGTTSRASATPMSCFQYDGLSHSEAMTPGLPEGGLGEKLCALVPVWFDHRCVIPTGIVDRFRSQFESTAGPAATSSAAVIPSGIVERFRSQFESTSAPPLLPPMYFKP